MAMISSMILVPNEIFRVFKSLFSRLHLQLKYAIIQILTGSRRKTGGNTMNILIVDDEIYSIRAIKSSIDWTKLGIKEVFVSYSCEHAKEVIKSNTVNIMVCDIEMPRETGLDLLKWVRKEGYTLESIFLTCHENFFFAQQAIQLDAFEYCVKPVVFSELEKVIERAADKVRADSQVRVFSNLGGYWLSNKEIVEKDFIRNLFVKTPPASPEELTRSSKARNISFELGDLYTVVLLYHRFDASVFPNWNENLYCYALENMAKEVIMEDLASNRIIRIADHFALLCSGEGRAELQKRCERYLQLCEEIMGTKPHYHIGDAVFYEEIAHDYSRISDSMKKGLHNNDNVYENTLSSVIRSANSYIEANIQNELFCDDVAKQVNLSTDYLSKVMKRATGFTLKEYIIRKKMERAMLLLRSEDIGVGEVARRVGYENFAYFSTIFKKHAGMPPSAYKSRKSESIPEK